MADASVNTCCKLKLVWKSVFSFRAERILKSDGDFFIKLKVARLRAFLWCMSQTSLETIAVVYERTKRTQQMCSQIGHNNTKNFLCSISSRHPLQFLEMVR